MLHQYVCVRSRLGVIRTGTGVGYPDDGGEMALSTCAAVVEAIHVAWAEHPDGYAKAAAPVTSAQV